MARWIEIPTHRIYEISRAQILCGEFQLMNERGEPIDTGGETYRIIRKSDGKMFTKARFVPADIAHFDCYYLEEA